MVEVALLVLTDGRGYLPETLPKALDMLPPIPVHICDDSGDEQLRRDLATFGTVHGQGPRLGYTKAMQRLFAVARTLPQPWVFLLEDDFTLDRPVPLEDMTAVLQAHPRLAQIALLRQPWFTNELEHGGLIEALEAQGVEFRQHDGWIEHKAGFTGNPSLIPRGLFDREWPDCSWSEAKFGRQLVRDGYSFAYWGRRETWVTHIGVRSGHGY